MQLTPELLSRLTPLDLKARQIVEGFISGLHKSPYYGFSVEFAEHRPYNPGDELKHLDWKVYGKTERFFVKQYEEETNLRCYMMMDVSSSMQFHHFADWSKLRYAVHLAAALAYMLHRQRDGFGLVPFDDHIKDIIVPKSSYGHLMHFYRSLSEILEEYDTGQASSRKTASAEAIHRLAEQIQKRSLIILFTDLFENKSRQQDLISALKHLRHNKHEVVLFHLLEKKSERALDFADNRMIFQDLETGVEMDVIPAQVREDYQKKMSEYSKKIKMVCSEANIMYEEIDTQQAFDYALLAFLNKRRRMM